MRNLLLLSLFAAAAFAQPQAYQAYGISGPSLTTSGSVYTINNSATYTGVGLGFHVTAAKTLSKVRVYVHQVTGSLAATDVTCGIQAESSLVPSGSDLASSHTLTSPVAAGWVEFTGFALALTAYTPYRIVLKNVNGTPASNWYSVRTFSVGGESYMSGPASAVESLNASAAWAQAGAQTIPIYRLEFNDGSFQGFPIENLTAVSSGINANFRLHTTGGGGITAAGVTFTTPAGVSWSVVGCGAAISKVGAPTGTLSCYIDSDNGSTVTNAKQSANTYAAAVVDTAFRATISPFYFSSPLTLAPSTKYRMYIIESAQSDSVLNYYGTVMYTMGNDANSLALLPMQGTWRGTYCVSGCTTRANWTDDNVNIPEMWLLLNPAGEATSTGGASGTRVYSH